MPKSGFQKKDKKSGCPYLQTFKPSTGYALNSHKKNNEQDILRPTNVEWFQLYIFPLIVPFINIPLK